MSREPNRDVLEFYSNDPIDKIVLTDSITIVNDGNSGDYQSAKIVTQNIPNPYGKKCLVNFKWVEDSFSNNTPDTRQYYGYTADGAKLGGLSGAVSVGVSPTEIKFRTANGLHGNVTAGVFTPISRTFEISYALYEAE